MPRSSTIAARCVALGTSIAQVIQDVSAFARRVRDARHDLNAINTDLLVIRTGLGVAQEDFSASGSKLPSALVDSVSQVLDSCDNTAERLHKAFLKLSCSLSPGDDWLALKQGFLINLRQDLNGSMIVLELALDYIALFGQQDALDSFIKFHAGDGTSPNEELLKRTDKEEIHINLTARDRLPSLLQAIRLLRSCITAPARQADASRPGPPRRTTTPRPDSLEPSLGESRRSGRSNSPVPLSATSSGSKGIGTWLAGVPFYEDARLLTHAAIKKVVTERRSSGSTTRGDITPSRGTFLSDDGTSESWTLVAPESRLRKVRSWCTDRSGESRSSKGTKSKASVKSPTTKTPPSPPTDVPTMANSDLSVIHRKLTNDRIAVSKGKRKELSVDERLALDRKLANLPASTSAVEVEHLLWDGANPMAAHPVYTYFFIRAAYEMSTEILKILMDFGADLTRTSATYQQYYSAIHAATAGVRLDTVKYLVDHGHSIDSPNTAGMTPLHLAVTKHNGLEVARCLVDMGADVNHETNNGATPLQATLTAPMLEGKERSLLIELLRAHGAAGDLRRDTSLRRGNFKGRHVLGIT